MGLNGRNRAVTLTDRDGRINCPGGGTVHDLLFGGRIFSEGYILFFCGTCERHIFLLMSKYGVIDAWQVEPHEVATIEREHMTEARQILEYLNRGAKRLDST